MELTATDIDNKKVEKEKEYKIALEALQTIELEELHIGREIIKLQGQRKDLQIALSKAKHNVKMLAQDIKILISEYWRARNGGV